MILENIYRHEDFERIKSQQVYKNNSFHTMLVKIKKDEVLKPHHATTDAFLLVAEGSIIFTIHEAATTLKKGDIISFKAFEMHSVQAVEDAILLVIK